MRDQRRTLMMAIGWWFFRRELRRRATRSTGRGGFGKLLRALVLVGVIAGGFVAWRKFAGGDDGGSGTPLQPEPEPAPQAPVVV